MDNTTEPNTQAITWALKELPRHHAEYKRARDYYAGRHQLTFATEKFRNAFGKTFGAMKVNLSELVVDTIADRLIVDGFAVKHRDGKDGGAEDALAGAALEIWQMNRMDERATDLITEALLCGESYLIVWPDVEADSRVVLYPQDAGQCAVEYHPEKPGYITRAAKCWLEEKRIRLNIYTEATIEKYVTKADATTLPDNAMDFEQYSPPNGSGKPREPWPVKNEWDKCPVFHLAHGKSRRSVLANLFDAQNGYNKTTCDMMVAEEFFAYPQRYAIGVEDDADGAAMEKWKAGQDLVWTVANEQAKLGQFAAGDPQCYLAIREAFRSDMAIIAGIPPYYFKLDGGGMPSGVALQILETRLKSRVRKLQERFGSVLADAMLLALRMDGKNVEGVRLKTLWRDTAPRDELALSQTQESKQRVGVSKHQSLRELGYSETEIDAIEAERSTEQKASGDLMGKLFSAGG